MKVDFMVIGAQKSGTTTLASALSLHPDVCMSAVKEPQYFNQAAEWRAGLPKYHRLYSPESGQLCGEASTAYTFLPEYRGTHARLFEYNPELRLIYIMRHPIERIRSHYAHRLVRRTVTAPIEEAVTGDPSYLNRSRYGVQLRPYLELFEHVLPLVFEDLIARPEQVLKETTRFLGIGDPQPSTPATSTHESTGEPYVSQRVARVVARPGVQAVVRALPPPIRNIARRRASRTIESKPELPEELQRTLWYFLEDDVAAVERLLGRRLHEWRTIGVSE